MKKYLFIPIALLLIIIFYNSYAYILGNQEKTIHVPGYPMEVHDHGTWVEHICGDDMTKDCYVIELLWPESIGPIIEPNKDFHVFIREYPDAPTGWGYVHSEIKEPYNTEDNLPLPHLYINDNTQIFNDYNDWYDALEQIYGIK